MFFKCLIAEIIDISVNNVDFFAKFKRLFPQ